MPPIYNSRNSRYKTPFGAVKAGEAVRVAILVPLWYNCDAPRLFLQRDGGGTREILLAKGEAESDSLWFATEFTVDEPGLYFYWFDLWRDYRKLFATPTGEAFETTGEGTKYQLTVYDPAFTTPKNVHGAVMYQIFPDRFYEGRPGKEMQYNERIYRADKTKEPYFWPDTQENGFLTWDYYGGDFAGIQQKLPYLEGLGVDWIYLNPIVEAHANHRYNAADFMNADPYLGTNEEFTALCQAAKRRGIKIMLDGVFSHTGADSIYFNKMGRYPSYGAWQGEDSAYRDWYHFAPDGSYESWWGFETLPHCNKENRTYRDFIVGPGGVIDTWMQRGAAGFRLDVADELPDDFIAEIRTAIKRHGDDCLLIGEVWEDATTKEAYGVRRRYFWGDELDGVMNYPFRTAILRFLQDGDAHHFSAAVQAICENYPPPALAAVTNHLSTHDTVRAITALAGEEMGDRDRTWQSGRMLNHEQYELGIRRMRLATVLQFTLPGVPCVYYGDEIGMQGYKDPFNRGYFDWYSKEGRLVPLVRQLAKLRHENPVFQTGRLYVLETQPAAIVYERRQKGNTVTVALHCGEGLCEVDFCGKPLLLNGMEWRIAVNGTPLE